jgi:hypothetical protein
LLHFDWAALRACVVLVAILIAVPWFILSVPVGNADKEARSSLLQAQQAGSSLAAKPLYRQCLLAASRYRALQRLYPPKRARMTQCGATALLGLANLDAASGFPLSAAARAQEALSMGLSASEAAQAQLLIAAATSAGFSAEQITVAKGLRFRVTEIKREMTGETSTVRDYRASITCEVVNTGPYAVAPATFAWQITEHAGQGLVTVPVLPPGQGVTVQFGFDTKTGQLNIIVREADVDLVPVSVTVSAG